MNQTTDAIVYCYTWLLTKSHIFFILLNDVYPTEQDVGTRGVFFDVLELGDFDAIDRIYFTDNSHSLSVSERPHKPALPYLGYQHIDAIYRRIGLEDVSQFRYCGTGWQADADFHLSWLLRGVQYLEKNLVEMISILIDSVNDKRKLCKITKPHGTWSKHYPFPCYAFITRVILSSTYYSK